MCVCGWGVMITGAGLNDLTTFLAKISTTRLFLNADTFGVSKKSCPGDCGT